MSRRANGEGSFDRRSDGSWRGRLGYTCPDTGEHRRITFYGATRAVVTTKVDDFKRAGFRREEQRQKLAMSVAEWCEHWVRVSVPSSGRIRESTLLSYEAIIDRYVVGDRVGTLPLQAVRAADIESWLLRLRSRKHTRRGEEVPLAPATIHRVFRVVSQALGLAHQQELIRKNPAAQVRAPSRTAPEANFLTAPQLEALLEGARRGASYTPILVLGTTGLRRGELLALHWDDVDLDRGLLRVQRTKTRTRHGSTIWPPKTRGSVRTVPLAPIAVKELRAHRVRQLRQHLEGVREASPLIFARADGRPPTEHTLTLDVARAAAQADLSLRVTPHTIRHTVATLLLESGVNPRVVAEWLGHSSPRITLEVYAHVTPNGFEEARDAIVRAIGA